MWPNSQFPADLMTFTKEILNGKLYFFVKYLENSCSEKLQEMQSQKPVMKSFLVNLQTYNFTLREKCPNTELFSDPYFPVFSSNTGKVPKPPRI